MIPEWPDIDMVVSREAIIPTPGWWAPWYDKEGWGDVSISLFQMDTAAIRGATRPKGFTPIATIFIFPAGWARYTDEDLKFKAELTIRYRLANLIKTYELSEGL